LAEPVKLPRVALLVVASATACKSVPEARVGVASIDFKGNHALSSGDLKERIATQPTARFLGLFRASWLRYQDFEPAVLEKDLERIRHYYRRRGFFDAQVTVGRVVPQGKFVDILIEVREGEPVAVRSITVRGLEGLPPALRSGALGAMKIARGQRFDEEKLEAATKAIRTFLTDRGYAYAKAIPHAVVDLGPRTADVSVDVEPGIQAVIGPITVEGLGDLPESVVRRTFGVEPGDPYASDDLEVGRRAVLDLGVFASADVVPDLTDPTRAQIPIRVTVTRSAIRGFRIGGGVLLDFSRADVHGLVAWEHRNFLGGMRHFVIEERPSIVFFPTALPGLHFPTHLLFANSISTTFNQPAFPEARTLSSLRLEFNHYPVILPPLDPNQQIMPGYNEVRGAIGPERTFSSVHLRTGVSYNYQANFPFTYFGEPNPAFNKVIVSYLDLRTDFDLRDDAVMPHQGFFVGNDFQVAGTVLGGDAGDFRVRPEMRVYFPVATQQTLAVRGVLGLLFPRNYGDLLGANFLTLPDAEVPAYIRDLQIYYFRGFFSGGADSNRGYGYREIGPHGVNPLLIPGSIAEEKARCTPVRPANPTLPVDPVSNPLVPNETYDERLCFVPSGGPSLWEASVELRTPVVGDLGMVFFVDASDVAVGVLQIRLDAPHLSTGFGIRYATPVGPLRVDLGFRIPGAQTIGRPPNPAVDGPAPAPLFGFLPAALSLGLGEAF
jgi:outer membrane protein insertion porin family/translocation and assembly module TamA